MNVRMYPRVSGALIESADLSFSAPFHEMLDEMLDKETMEGLCGERYRVLMESLRDGNKDPMNFISATEMYLKPDSIRIKKTFHSLILCYAAEGIIPITQAKLGEVVEKFLHAAGGWRTRTVEHKDAMAFRLPGSYEGGKRR